MASKITYKDVADGSYQNPYQEFTYIIAAGDRLVVDSVFNCFRVLHKSGGELSVIIGENSVETKFKGIGIAFKSINLNDRIILINNGVTDMNITFCVSIGDTFDDRVDYPFTFTDFRGINILTTATLISSGSNFYKINSGTSDLFLGDSSVTITNCLRVVANTTENISYEGDLYGIRSGVAGRAYMAIQRYE